MSNHLGDTNKMVETPRTDRVLKNCNGWHHVPIELARELERELNAANDRIKRLEDYGNALVAHVYAYRTQRQWTEESYHDLIQTIADWDKAKATKP